MAGKSDYAENKTLELLVGKTAFATPTTRIALFTAAPTDAGGGTEFTGLARKTTAGADWTTAASGSISNATLLDMGIVSVAGTVTHAALFDAVSAGNMLYWAPLAASRAFLVGDAARFPIGSVVLTED